jgi:hypothetical protein
VVVLFLVFEEPPYYSIVAGLIFPPTVYKDSSATPHPSSPAFIVVYFLDDCPSEWREMESQRDFDLDFLYS